MRVLAVPAAACVGAVLLALMHAGGAGTRAPASVPSAGARQEASAEQQLAERYAPIVFQRVQEEPCAREGNSYDPAPVELVLGNPDVQLRDAASGDAVVAEAPTAADLAGKGPDYYLDFPGDPRRPGCQYEEAYRALTERYPPTTYAHIAREDGKSGLAVQYWFFYYFNDWVNRHESDWEMVQLVFAADSAEEALSQEPREAGYSQHSNGEKADWDSDKLKREGTRPLVFAAQGSQASFYDSETYLGLAENGAGFGCDSASDPVRRVDPVVQVVPDQVSGPDDPFAWTTFEGRWGQRISSEFNGPTGPNTKRIWEQPITWQEGLRSTNPVVPTENLFGVNATGEFCAVVGAAGRIFGLATKWPYAVAAVSGAVLLLVASVGGTMVSATLRSGSIELAPSELRRRRSFREIMTATGRVYRDRAWLFLSIAWIMLPLGALASIVGLLALAPLNGDALQGLVDLPALVALVFGIAQGAASFLLVLDASIAAVGIIERRGSASMLDAYRQVFARFWPLAWARLRAFFWIVVLSITVVGIPLAIRRAVQWYFIEQSVLIEGRGAGESMRMSREAVDGSWWRTLGIMLSLTLFMGLTAPAIAAILLLFTPMSIAFVNLIAALAYGALIPFLAIAATLLFFDLQCGWSDATPETSRPEPERPAATQYPATAP